MSDRKPAVILITTDEMRKDSLRCYGNEAISTPNLDRLADEGIRFDAAYTVSPWCLPARCSILTGLFPHNSRAYSNFRKCSLNAGVPNLYRLMKGGGYTTAHVGKCHYAPVPYSEPRPDRTLPYDDFRDYYVSLGIDHLDLQDDKQVSVWFYDDYSKQLDAAGHLEAYRDAVWNRDLQKVFPFPGPAQWHPDAWVGRKAAQFLDAHDAGSPLFMWVSFSGPHYTFDPPEEYLDRVDLDKVGVGRFEEGEFDDERRIHHASYHGRDGIDGCGPAPEHACKNYTDEYWRKLRAHYFANVAQIDDEVGRVLDAARRKFGDDVLVIFTTDHGEMLGNHRLWGKNNCAYEDVLNVPLLVRYPGPPEPQRTDARVMLTDILATCATAAGLDLPDRTDGMDFRENIARGGYEYVFSEGEGFLSVSDGRTKYIHVRQGNKQFTECFDLEADPNETRNIADDPASAERLAAIRKAAIDFLLTDLLP